jgi:hypothetical protein
MRNLPPNCSMQLETAAPSGAQSLPRALSMATTGSSLLGVSPPTVVPFAPPTPPPVTEHGEQSLRHLGYRATAPAFVAQSPPTSQYLQLSAGLGMGAAPFESKLRQFLFRVNSRPCFRDGYLRIRARHYVKLRSRFPTLVYDFPQEHGGRKASPPSIRSNCRAGRRLPRSAS